jgi:hypothetical protein
LFWTERGWWITCNYPTVFKEKNMRNRKHTTCAICWLKPVLHEEKHQTGLNSRRTNATKTMSDMFRHRSGTGKSLSDEVRRRIGKGLKNSAVMMGILNAWYYLPTQMQ